MQMIALKRVKYPSGPAGREYKSGEPLTALSDRDAKALWIAGRAKYVATSSPAPTYQTAALAPEPAPVPLDEAPQPRARRGYRRRDMTAED